MIRDATREGTSQADARDRLLEALKDRTGFSRSELTATSTIAEAAKLWLVEIDRYVAEGQRAPNTGGQYRSVVARHVDQPIGSVRLREATTPRLDAFLVAFRTEHGRALTKTLRTVLNGIFGYAMRNGALERNPLREVSRIETHEACYTEITRCSGGDCVGATLLKGQNGHPDWVRLFSTINRMSGLAVTRDEFAAFVSQVKVGQFDELAGMEVAA